jgi:putative membrane protein
MVGFLLRAAICALGLWVASQLLDGLVFTTPAKLLLAAVLLGIVNGFVRPLAFILTLPITIITLGLFLLVLNALLFWGVASILPGFHVTGFWAAVLGAILYSVIGWLLSNLIPDRAR